MHYGNGFTFGDILEMTAKERDWFMRRLLRQIKAERANRK